VFTLEEVRTLLSLVAEKYGQGYSRDPKVRALQDKLAQLAEIAAAKAKRDAKAASEKREGC
jgi:hypothetical protein